MELTPDLITQFGLIQKVSTGNGMIDMVVVMLLPIVLRTVLPIVINWVKNFFSRSEPESYDEVYERQIEYKKDGSYYWYSNGDDPSNTILQKAVLNFINTKVEVLRQLPTANLEIKKKVFEVTPLETGEEEDEQVTRMKQNAYSTNVVPKAGVWIDLQNGIEFMRQLEEGDENNTRKSKTIFFLKAVQPAGSKDKPETKDKAVRLIEAFIDEALELYRNQQAQKSDYSRYLYIPVLSGFSAMLANKDEEDKSSAVYKRYKLSEEKQFSSFFHPDKAAIVGLVDAFQQKKGKFGIAGYPQKLGFLLYGPPGTGKTSFIKALAQYTKRSVISIPLTKISTNQELMDIMMDQKIKCNDSDSFSLPYSKTIFILEDVDAAGSVVHRRSDEPDAAAQELIQKMKEAARKKAEAAKKEKEKKKKEKKEGDEIEPAETSEDEASEDKGKKGRAIGPMPAFGRGLWGGDDDLNLAGLLNVLDGVVDTPNRIVIMTTNHPEKLDPALIRPGRINKKIYMGRICINEALCMIRHYFHADGNIPEHIVERLRAVFVDEALSPAELETMCADHDTSEEIVDQLVARFTGVARAAPAMPQLPPALVEALAAAEDEPADFEASVKADLEALKLKEAEEAKEALRRATQTDEDEASTSTPTSVADTQTEEEDAATTTATAAAAQAEEVGSDEQVESETEGLVVKQAVEELVQELTSARLHGNKAAPVTSCHVALSPIVLSPMLSPANSIITC